MLTFSFFAMHASKSKPFFFICPNWCLVLCLRVVCLLWMIIKQINHYDICLCSCCKLLGFCQRLKDDFPLARWWRSLAMKTLKVAFSLFLMLTTVCWLFPVLSCLVFAVFSYSFFICEILNVFIINWVVLSVPDQLFFF